MHPTLDRSDGLWSPHRRSLTIGLVLTITLVAFEALAISTIMPKVASELDGLELYGWVFTSFLLGSLIGIVVVGGAIDRRGLALPFALGLGLFAVGLLVGGLAPSMPVLVAARFVQGLGGGTVPPIAYVAIGRSLPETLRARMFATMSTAWVLPGVIGPAIAGAIGELVGWRAVFLGLLPLIALVGTMTLSALRVVAAAPADAASDRRRRHGPAPPPAGHSRLARRGIGDGRPDGPRTRRVRCRVDRRCRHRPVRPAAPDAAGDAGGPAGPARRGPAARRADVHVLRLRRLRRARPGQLARPVADRSRDRPDRDDRPVDGRLVDPGAEHDALARPTASSRPGSPRPCSGWQGSWSCSARTSAGWSASRPSGWPASGWAWPTRRSH